MFLVAFQYNTILIATISYSCVQCRCCVSSPAFLPGMLSVALCFIAIFLRLRVRFSPFCFCLVWFEMLCSVSLLCDALFCVFAVRCSVLLCSSFIICTVVRYSAAFVVLSCSFFLSVHCVGNQCFLSLFVAMVHSVHCCLLSDSVQCW